MSILRRKLNEILTKVQSSSTQIHLKRLQNLYHESNFEDFLKEFLKCLNICLESKHDQDPYRDKLVTFLSKFCTSLKKPTEDTELLCPFLKEIFLHIFKEFNPDVISPYRVCQFIKLLLKEIGEQEAFLDEDICIQIRDLMLERIDDIKAKVRVEAIEVLKRLQDPLDNNDMIIKAFIERLNDDNSQVRKSIVHSIGLNILSIPAVVDRCLDFSDEVRLVSYDKLSKIPIKVLKIAQRQFILRNGFADKSPKVKNFILKNLLPQWLSTYNGDYFSLIRVLKLDADEKDFKQTTKLVEKILEELFKETEISTIMEALPLGKEKLIPSKEIQWEEIIFWRCLQQFLRNQADENDYVDKILPELLFFCDYVKKVYKFKSLLKTDWDMVQHDQIMLELLKICHDFDFSDEVGRNALQNLISTVLIDGPSLYEVTELLVKMFEKLVPDVEECAMKICEIIAEIQTPMTPIAPSEDMVRKKNVKLAEYRCKLNVAEDKQETAIEKEDWDKAAELKKEISAIKEKITEITKEFDSANQTRVPKTDTVTLCRCLDILTASLQNSKIKTLPESYRAFQDMFLPTLLHSRQADVFWKALKLLCLFAYYDEKLAKESMKVFFTPLLAHKFRPVYGDQTTITAINCITDMLLLYGSKIFDEEDNALSLSQRPNNKRRILDRTTIDETICNEPPPPSLELVIEILSELLDDTDDQIKETAGDSLITLIITERVRSPLLFSKLLLKWFSPNTLKNVRLRQMIGLLFTDYVPESPYSLEIIEQAFVPTLEAIIEAPRSSPLADIDVESVSRFLAALSQPGRHKKNVGLDAHKNIAMILCREICDRPNNKRTLTYLKTLLCLEPVKEDDAALDILKKQLDTMQELIKERSAQKYVFKYRHKLDNNLTNNENTTSATSVNSNLPESTITTNTDSVNVTTEAQKDLESSRYSSLSVKRRKRQSKENGEQTQNENVVVHTSQNLGLEKNNSRVVLSETDSEYATENEANGHKKKICVITDEQINLPHSQTCVQIHTRSNPECTTENSEPNKRDLVIQLKRNEKIDKMCSNLAGNSQRNETSPIVQNQLKVTLIRSPKIDQMCSKTATKSPKRNKKQSTPIIIKTPVNMPDKGTPKVNKITESAAENIPQNDKKRSRGRPPLKPKILEENNISTRVLREKKSKRIKTRKGKMSCRPSTN